MKLKERQEAGVSITVITLSSDSYLESRAEKLKKL